MAGTSLAMRLMASRSTVQLSSLSRRSIATSQALRAEPLRPNFQSISRIARRGYADAAPSPSPATPSPSPAPKPKKRFRVLRWAWRLTWLSALGLTGALSFSIYSLRHPEEQIEPDPEKKTLVILGMLSSHPISSLLVPSGALLIPSLL
jgi:NADH:ubiquinone reductase (non-electrogenic)